MADSSLAEGLATLERRTKAAIIATYVVIGFAVALLIGEILEAIGVIDLNSIEVGPLVLLYVVAGLGFTLAFFVSVVLVSMWIYRAHANLQAASIETEFTPGWAVGWFFVPIMNLFKPFQAMRELWNASHMAVDDFGGDAPDDVKFWWGCYVLSGILSWVSIRMNGWQGETVNPVGITIGAVSTALLIGSAWYLLRIMRDVNNAQRNEMTASEVFS